MYHTYQHCTWILNKNFFKTSNKCPILGVEPGNIFILEGVFPLSYDLSLKNYIHTKLLVINNIQIVAINVDNILTNKLKTDKSLDRISKIWYYSLNKLLFEH